MSLRGQEAERRRPSSPLLMRQGPFTFFLFLLCCSTFAFTLANNEKPFDVRKHLSTVTSYSSAADFKDINLSVNAAIPDGCSPVHLNLVARHGTRSPTKKRIKELDHLAARLKSLLTEARSEKDISLLHKIPDWLWQWESPWKGRKKGGELTTKGENELYQLAVRIRERFAELFDVEYHPDTYSIRATQVPRASASAVAFGTGLFSGKGSLGQGKHHAFSLITESRASDIRLRFYETCETYNDYRIKQEPLVEELKQPVLDEITSELTKRYPLNFTTQDVASLWFLCKQEASLFDITKQACSLFTPAEVFLLEWTDDFEVFILKGYGNAVNYRMGVPLLEDVVQSMEQAIIAKENHTWGSFEKARLRFAHAETVVPFTCLLGLFLEGSEFEKIQSEKPLQLPPKPPQKRNWKGSNVAPYGGNNMLVLYRCSHTDSKKMLSPHDYIDNYFVHVLHNEHPVLMPGCGGKYFCPFRTFKEKIVDPHLKWDFDSVCKPVKQLTKAEVPLGSCALSCQISRSIRWLLFLDRSKSNATMDENEL